MRKTRIAVLVSGGGTNLQALIDAQNEGRIPSGDICAVISSRADAYALVRAENAGIEGVCIPGKSADFEERLTEALLARSVDMLILAGFMRILSAEFTAAWQGRIINIHPALIPSFCGEGYYGLHVHEAALRRGVLVTGATVHYVNEIPDGGEIILQKAVEVLPGDTAEALQQRVMREAEWVILPQAAELAAKKIQEETQNG
ncbi:MAG: phosphoribosylglycinamide formyltransferase [Oscillospiraceae bacterium]